MLKSMRSAFSLKDMLLPTVRMEIGFSQENDCGCVVSDYWESVVSSIIVRIIKSNAGVVNDKVWVRLILIFDNR